MKSFFIVALLGSLTLVLANDEPKLASQDFAVKGCKSVEPYDFNEDFLYGLVGSGNAYIYYGSKYFMLWTTETYMNGGWNEKYAGKICLRIGPKSVSAFGSTVTIKCKILTKGDRECLAEDANDPVGKVYGNVRHILAWTDNTNYILVIRCVNGQNSDWLIVQKNEDDFMASDKKDEVAGILTKYGFDIEEHFKANYDKCPAPTHK